MNTFSEVLENSGYDAQFWEQAVQQYWYDSTGFDEVEWLDTSIGVNFAYRLCWEFSDNGVRGSIYEMFDIALKAAFEMEYE